MFKAHEEKTTKADREVKRVVVVRILFSRSFYWREIIVSTKSHCYQTRGHQTKGNKQSDLVTFIANSLFLLDHTLKA